MAASISTGGSTLTRIILALAAAATVAATIGASAAPSDTGAILTSAKHVFWGQSTAVDSASAISSGTAATPARARSASSRSPPCTSSGGAPSGRARLPDRRHRRQALLVEDAPELPRLVLPEPRREPLGEHPDAVLQPTARRLDLCVGGAGFVTNPKKQLKGVWTDPTPVPDDIVTLGLAENLVDDPIAAEAMRASAHFGYDPQATYIILTPPRPVATGQPVYCGYHTQTASIDGLGNPYRIQYAFIPWQNTNWPGVGTSDAACISSTPPRTRSGTGSSTAGRSSPATSTRRPSPTRTTSRRGRTGGSTRRAVRTATSARGREHVEHHARRPPIRRAANVEQRGLRRNRRRLRPER